jgi:hypothetical protein
LAQWCINFIWGQYYPPSPICSDLLYALFFQEYIKRNGVSVLPEDNLSDTSLLIKSSSSNSSLYGTDVVIEDQKQTVEDLAIHVLYCKFVCRRCGYTCTLL